MTDAYTRVRRTWATAETRFGKTATCVAVSVAIALIWFVPTIFSRPAGLDRYFLHAAAIAGYEHGGLASVRAHIGMAYRLQHPGWFPLATVPLDVWLTDAKAQTIKVLQYCLIVANFGFFAYACRRLTASSACTLLAIACTLAVWQLRPANDPVLGTTLVTPWLGVFVFGALAAWSDYLASRQRISLVVCCAALALAMLTSPVAWGLAIALPVIALLMRRTEVAAAIAVTALPLFVSTLALGAPVIPRDAGAYLKSVATQVFAAIPATFRATGGVPIGSVPDLYHNGTHYIDDRFITIPSIGIWEWFAVLACTAAAFFGIRALRSDQTGAATRRSALAAVALIAASALTAAVNTPIHGAQRFGSALEMVYFAYFGVGLLAAVLVQSLAGGARNRQFIAALGALTVMLLTYGNTRVDSAIIDQTQRVDDARGLVQRAAGSGLFARVASGATIAIPRTDWLVDASHWRLGGAYALYHYSGRRYRVITYAEVPAKTPNNLWALQTSRKSGIFVTLAHVVGKRNGSLLTDRAFGYTAIPAVWQNRDMFARGIATTILLGRDGAVIDARRKCGPVTLDNAFLPNLPSLEWGAGFYQKGPVGYPTSTPPPLWGLGTMVAPYPKIFMSTSGVLTLFPSACSSTALNLSAVAVSARPARLTIVGARHTDVLRISQKPHMFWLRFLHPNGPIRLHLTTNAPEANLDPIIFRYERDEPRDLRLIVEAGRLWEDATFRHKSTR